MLKGKITSTPASPGRDYLVKVGAVEVDVTDDVRAIVASEVEQACKDYERVIAELRAAHADIAARYQQIQRIVLAGGTGMPTG